MQKKRISVLGTGLVGRTIAMELSRKYDVTAFDLDFARLKEMQRQFPAIRIRVANLADPKKVRACVQGADLVMLAVPGFMGFKTLEAVIDGLEPGKSIVDISFFPEDSFLLDAKARMKQLTVVVDCGVAPGMGNVILGHYALGKGLRISRFECLVGGLPVKRVWPFEYKAPFSPVDVVQEYLRPARYAENSHVVTKPALSDCELVNFDSVGTLEAFNTDGLRTLITTMKSEVPNMKEKTLRYPGSHIQTIKAMKALGLFSEMPIEMPDGSKVRPLDVTTEILKTVWKSEPNENEFTVMRVTLMGEGGKTVVYDLFDTYDPRTGMSSMARTTGYTATAAAELVLDGKFIRSGICPPEFIGAEAGCFEAILAYLKERNVIYKKTGSF